MICQECVEFQQQVLGLYLLTLSGALVSVLSVATCRYLQKRRVQRWRGMTLQRIFQDVRRPGTSFARPLEEALELLTYPRPGGNKRRASDSIARGDRKAESEAQKSGSEDQRSGTDRDCSSGKNVADEEKEARGKE